MGASPSRGEERFKREGSLLARLSHPNIARLIDAGVSATAQPYLVLEHIDGLPIDRYCDEHALGVEARVQLFLDVLAAVAHAHANLVVHRDLKPSNVLVSADGRVKLLDFGIAKLLQSDEWACADARGRHGTDPGVRGAGAGHRERMTTATDVYSLGVLLYVLLCGRHPAGGGFKSPADLVRAIVDTDPPRLSEAVSSPRRITSDTSEDRRRPSPATPHAVPPRPSACAASSAATSTPSSQGAEEECAGAVSLGHRARRRFRRCLAHQPIGARPDTLSYRAAKFAQRIRAAPAAAAGVVALVAAIVAFNAVRLTAERDRARIEAEKAEKVSELFTTSSPAPIHTAIGRIRRPRSARRRQAARPEGARRPTRSPGRDAHGHGAGVPAARAADKALPLLERALQIGEAAAENARLAQTLDDLGVLARMNGDAARSVALLKESLDAGTRSSDAAQGRRRDVVELGRVVRRPWQQGGG